MRAVVLGAGGRESALAWGFARSSSVSEVLVAPGNPGTAAFAGSIEVDIEDPAQVVDAVRSVRADLVVVGPEAPLVGGIGDALRNSGTPVFGPDAAAARLEGSKSFAKELMQQAGVPTASGRTFTDVDAALAYMDELGPPYVIKADGLAAGKGVVVTGDRAEAEVALRERLVEGKFGEAGRRVVVEEFLDGPEASVIAFVDGREVLVCQPAQDYKRAGDRDEGPNTGGMGSYSPVPTCPSSVVELIAAEVMQPAVDALAGRNTPFVGALYAGLALTSRGPRVIEFNARFGDPETQALLPRLSSDLGELCLAAARGELAGMTLDWTSEACVSVVLASGGYPGSYPVGQVIEGVDAAAALDGVEVFHSGTAVRDGDLVTAGGRVLAVSALGNDFSEARAKAYAAAEMISFEGKYLRTDIAARAEGAEVNA